MSAAFALEAVLVGFVLLAAGADLAWRKIPNRLILAGLCAALGLHLWHGAGAFPSAWLGGALTGLVLLLPLYLLRGMAAGDVKLMAMVGAFAGPELALRIGLATCLIGGLMALAIALYRGRLRDALHNIGFLFGALQARAPLALPPGASVGGMPYGPAIALGTMLLLAWRHG